MGENHIFLGDRRFLIYVVIFVLGEMEGREGSLIVK